MITKTLLTADDLARMPDDASVQIELDEGELITMPPAEEEHGYLEMDLGSSGQFVRGEKAWQGLWRRHRISAQRSNGLCPRCCLRSERSRRGHPQQELREGRPRSGSGDLFALGRHSPIHSQGKAVFGRGMSYGVGRLSQARRSRGLRGARRQAHAACRRPAGSPRLASRFLGEGRRAIRISCAAYSSEYHVRHFRWSGNRRISNIPAMNPPTCANQATPPPV